MTGWPGTDSHVTSEHGNATTITSIKSIRCCRGKLVNYCLFSGTFYNLDYITSTDRIPWIMNCKEHERKQSWLIWYTYRAICLMWLCTITKKLGQDSPSPSRDLNLGSHIMKQQWIGIDVLRFNSHCPNRYCFNTLSWQFRGNVKIINQLLPPRPVTLHGQDVRNFLVPYETTPTKTKTARFSYKGKAIPKTGRGDP
jgi:hypothetical protein